MIFLLFLLSFSSPAWNSEHYFTLDSQPFLYTKPGDEMGDLWSEIFHFDGLEARREKFIFYGTEGKQQEFYGGF